MDIQRCHISVHAVLAVAASVVTLSCAASTDETPYYAGVGEQPLAPGEGTEPTPGGGDPVAPPVMTPGPGPAPVPVPPAPGGVTPPVDPPLTAPPPVNPGNPPAPPPGVVFTNPPAPVGFDLTAVVKGIAPTVDMDFDGKPDAVPVDTDGDGVEDALAIDTNKDSFPDQMVRDIDQDGVFEAIVEMPVPTPPPVPQLCNLEFSVLTVSVGEKYKPRNSGASWLTDADGKFVRTFEVWAARRDGHVQKWVASSAKNKVDAITAATSGNHQMRTIKWDCKGLDGAILPNGTYTLHVEHTEKNGAGPYLAVPFARTGDMPLDITVPDAMGFSGAHLVYQPTAGAAPQPPVAQ